MIAVINAVNIVHYSWPKAGPESPSAPAGDPISHHSPESLLTVESDSEGLVNMIPAVQLRAKEPFYYHEKRKNPSWWWF